MALILSLDSPAFAAPNKVKGSEGVKCVLMEFPAEKAMGTIQFKRKSPRGFSYENPTVKTVPAKGRISVTPSYVVKYIPDYHTGLNLEKLKSLDKKSIVSLDLSKLPIKGKELSSVGKFYNLEDLRLKNTDLEDAGLVYLINLTKLYRLNLASTSITFHGLKFIVRNKNIGDLILENNQLGDASTKYLAGFTHLDRLNLRRTGISDFAAQSLTSLDNLEFLSLAENHRITDSALRDFKKLNKLKELSLEGTLVTPLMVTYLKKCKSLKVLRISNDRRHPNRVSVIKQGLPRCRIEVNKQKDIPMEVFSPLHK